jgi:hypothetical protein
MADRVNSDRGAVPPTARPAPSDDAAFLALSQRLTGVASLGPHIAARHLQTLRASVGDAAVTAWLQRYRESQDDDGMQGADVSALMDRDAEFAALARTVLKFWYTGLAPSTGADPTFAHPEDYFDALMWSAVGAHPPASSDGYYGHWRLPPDSGGCA